MLGISDEEFLRGNVPMTKREIRTLTLAAARLDVDSVVVDVGAGTGSISIEAARLAHGGKVFAIERNAEAIELIRRNAEKFSVGNVEIICAAAPDGLEALPELDAAIIGGSGGRLNAILDIIFDKLKTGGRLVLNAITMQTATTAIEYLRTRGLPYDAFQVQITRLERVGRYDMAKALNPVWIIAATKEI